MSFITIVEDDEKTPMRFGESTILYRRYSTATHNILSKKYRTKRKNRQGEIYFEVDDIGLNNAIIDNVVAELIEVKDGRGGFVETTLENKLRLPGDVMEDLMQASGAASIMRGDEKEPDPTQPTSSDV